MKKWRKLKEILNGLPKKAAMGIKREMHHLDEE